MTIIDRLPFAGRAHVIKVRGDAVDVYWNQIEDADSPRLPLIGLRTLIIELSMLGMCRFRGDDVDVGEW